jgi:predicted phage tail protein
MTRMNQLHGRGGGGGKAGGGEGRAAVEAPNTLRSKSVARVFDLVSEGEIVGLVDGAKSIYFNNTRLQNDDNTFNFEGVEWSQRYGLPDQEYVSGFPAAETEVSVGTEVTYDTPITRTVTGTSLTALRVTIRFPGMFKQEQSSGDMNPTSVSFAIDVKPAGGSYITKIDTTVSGKNTSPSERSYRIELFGNSPWDVRVRRISADSESTSLQNATYWSSYTMITDHKFTYPNSAYIAMAVDSKLFGGSVPTRSYDVKGLKIQVPNNYDPVTRAYTGIWDGGFKLAWTDNPAWVYYDLCASKRYGLGRFIAAAQIDKWSLYSIGQYCDALVPNGFGGTEPRFTFNGIINSREDAFKVLQAIASVFRGMSYWGTGTVTAVQDAPADPVQLVTEANVIAGEFTYSGSALRARHTTVLVLWNDPDNNYEPQVEVVENPEDVAKWGVRQTEISAFACTSRGQAHRIGKWILDSEKNETQLLTYRCGLDHASLRPGDIIAVMDRNYAGIDGGGRVADATTTTATLDRPVVLAAATAYTIMFTLSDGSVQQRAVTSPAGTHTVVSFVALTSAPQADSIWIISSALVAPRTFRVMSVGEIDPHTFEVTALLHDPTKFARIEQNLVLEPINYTLLPTGPLRAPTDLTQASFMYRVGQLIDTALVMSWRSPDDIRIKFFEVQVLKPNQVAYEEVTTTTDVSTSLYSVVDGTYRFRVRSINDSGGTSQWVVSNEFVVAAISAAPGPVTNFQIQVLGDYASLSWDTAVDLDLSHYRLKFSPLTIGATWGSSVDLIPRVDATSIQVPAMVGTYLIKAVDLSGQESPTATSAINGVSGVLNFNAVATISEHPSFNSVGSTKTHVSVPVTPGSTLVLDVSDTIGSWASLGAVTSLGQGNWTTGEYTFKGTDLGGVFVSRITALIKASGNNLSNTIGSWSSLGSVQTLGGSAPDQWGAKLQIRTTDDDPAGSPTWSAWRDFAVGDYRCRATEYKLILTTETIAVRPEVTELTVTIDMDDRVESGSTASSGASDTTITFSPAYKATPEVAITVKDGATGDYIDLVSKTTSSFVFSIRNSSAARVSRNVDWIAKGYGVS